MVRIQSAQGRGEQWSCRRDGRWYFAPLRLCYPRLAGKSRVHKPFFVVPRPDRACKRQRRQLLGWDCYSKFPHGWFAFLAEHFWDIIKSYFTAVLACGCEFLFALMRPDFWIAPVVSHACVSTSNRVYILSIIGNIICVIYIFNLKCK